MTVPFPTRRPWLEALRSSPAFVALALTLLPAPAYAKPKTGPETTLNLETLGFPGASQALLAQGASLLTVNFADNTHLLVTFGRRGLVSRLAHDTPGDQDRNIAVLLIDLPSGHVVAQTEWRVHDYGHYLWPLGYGRFLVRIQNSLSTFAPAANLANGHAFDRTSFPQVSGSIDAVIVSSDDQLVTVETGRPGPRPDPAAAARAKAAAAYAARPHFAADAHTDPPPPPGPDDTPAEVVPLGPSETLHFFRISGDGTLDVPIHVDAAGFIGADSTTSLPIFSDGYLIPTAHSRTGWQVAFHPFRGKDIPFPIMDSSCAPTMYRVSPSQFLSFNCRGITGNVVLAAYDLEKHEIWEEPLPSSTLPPAYALSPQTGRFAISRITDIDSANGAADATGPSINNVFAQEVRVYQTQTGDLLLKAQCTPVFKTEENFDLSPDGLHAAVVHAGLIEIYRLPNLTRQDREDLAELARVAPPAYTGPIDLRGFSGVVEAAATPSPLPANAVLWGDPQTPRRPPSLLNPGEQTEFHDNSHPSQ